MNREVKNRIYVQRIWKTRINAKRFILDSKIQEAALNTWEKEFKKILFIIERNEYLNKK
jgi:hypothetical protein